MATSFDRWEKDPFFPAAEEVQESADRCAASFLFLPFLRCASGFLFWCSFWSFEGLGFLLV